MTLDLSAIIRDGVATADTITKSMQATVIHHAYTGQDRSGTPSYAAPVSYKAIVEYRQESRKTDEGTEQLSRAYVAFIQPVAANGAAGRVEPIDERDLITLPDMTTGPILEVRGLTDDDTNRPYFSEVWLGRVMKV